MKFSLRETVIKSFVMKRIGVTSFFSSFSNEPAFCIILIKFVHGKHGACLIGYLCTIIFALFIRVDEFHLWIISLFDLCGS